MSQFPTLPAYDAEKTSEYGNFDPVPAGSYFVRIEDYEIKETKAGDMAQFCLSYRILEGDFTDRIIFDRINIENLPQFPVASLDVKKQKAIAIGNSARKSLELAAFGRTGIKNPAEFIGRMMFVTVKVREAEGSFPASNSVSRYSLADIIQPSPQPSQVVAHTQPQAVPSRAVCAQPSAAKVPWKK